jgi:hypothetical protein
MKYIDEKLAQRITQLLTIDLEELVATPLCATTINKM